MAENRKKRWGIWLLLLIGALGGVTVAGALTFLDLTDTPSSYYNFSYYPVSINSSGDGLDFFTTIRLEGIQSIYENRSNITFNKFGDVIVTVDPIELNTYDFSPRTTRTTIQDGWRITGTDSYCTGRTCSDYYEVCELTGVKRDFPVLYFVEELRPSAMYEWKEVKYTQTIPTIEFFVDENGTKKSRTTGYEEQEYTIPQWKKLAGYLISEGQSVGNTLEGLINFGKNDCKQFRFDSPALLGDSYKSGLTWLDPLINNTWYFIGNSSNTSNLWNADDNETETTVEFTNSNKTFELPLVGSASGLATGQTLYYTLDAADLTGGLPDDVTGNGYDAKNNSAITGASGVINEGFQYDSVSSAVGDYTGMPENLPDFDHTAHSVCLWAKQDTSTQTSGGNRCFVGWREGTTIMYACPNQASDNKVYIRWRDNGGTQIGDFYSAEHSKTEWFHWCLVVNSTHVTHYINGSNPVSTANTFTQDLSTQNGILGGEPYSGSRYFFDGWIDEFGVWASRALSSADVKELYNSYSGVQYPYSTSSYNVSANKYVSLPIPLNNKTKNFTTYYNYTGSSNLNVSIKVTCDYYNTTPTYYTITSQGETNTCPNTVGAIQYNITLDGTSTETPVMEWLNITTELTPKPVDAIYHTQFIVQDENEIRLFNVSKRTGNANLRGDLTASNVYVNATVWDDLRFPSTDLTLSAVDDPNCRVFNNDFYACGFAAAGTEQLFGSFQLPHSWREGSTLKPHFHWSPENANAGVVTWCLDYSCANIGDTFPSKSTLCINDEASGTSFDHQMTSMMNLTNSLTASSQCMTRIYRNGTGSADTYGSEAFLIEFDVHYQVYRFGQGGFD